MANPFSFILDPWYRRRAASAYAARQRLLAERHGRLTADAVSAQIKYGATDGKINSARPEQVVWLEDAELADESTRGLGHRLVWGVSADATAKPWSTNGTTDAFDDRTKFRKRLRMAYGAARNLGGAHLLMVTDDNLPLDKPLPPGAHNIRALKVITARDAKPDTYDKDFTSELELGAVELWNVSPNRPGVSYTSRVVHHSRMVYIPGLPALPGQALPRRGYDLPALQAYWKGLGALQLALESATLGAVELSTAWVKLKTSLAAMSGSEALTAEQRLEVYQSSASMARLKVLMGDDETGRDNVALTGLRNEVILALYEAIASVEGIPLTALLGMSPSGFSTDDASGTRTYHRALGNIRDDILTPAIWRVHEVQFGQRVPHEWAPLGEANPADSAALVSSGVADPDELRERHGLAPREVERVEPTQEEIDAARAALERQRAEGVVP